MKSFFNLILICCVLAMAVQASAQDTGNTADLIKQGTQLNNQGNYAGAIEKYKEALKTDSNNAQANYQMGFSLQAAGRGNEAIPYAEKAIKGNGSATLTAASYALLGSIYDEDHQTQKAIDTYKEGIKLNPAFQQLNLTSDSPIRAISNMPRQRSKLSSLLNSTRSTRAANGCMRWLRSIKIKG